MPYLTSESVTKLESETERQIRLARKGIASVRATVYRRALNRTTSVKQDDGKQLETLASSIRYLRQVSGLTLRALGVKAGCSLNQISNIERGQNWPSVRVYQGICRGLGVRK